MTDEVKKKLRELLRYKIVYPKGCGHESDNEGTESAGVLHAD